MMKIKNLLLILISMGFSLSVFANSANPMICKDVQGFSEVKQKINTMDKSFHWNSPSCRIVGTKSIFPRKNDKGVMQFEPGLQLFVYEDYQLKFICLPGWTCKPWQF